MSGKIYILTILLLMFALFVNSGCGDDDDDDNDSAGDDEGDDDDEVDDDDTAADDDDDDDDTTENLVWQDPPTYDSMLRQEAKVYCENLNFNGHDDWHLPTISELRSLIQGCDENTGVGGACGVIDDCLDSSCQNDECSGCEDGGPGTEGAYWPETMSGKIGTYWSSSEVADNHTFSWYVMFNSARVDNFVEDNDSPYAYTRCVRFSD